jgi:arabinose-5-phosphate isomerase
MNNIKFVVFDFDGVFTDGKCYFDEYNVHKYYNIKDGMALSLLRRHTIQYGLISSYNTNKDILINGKNVDEQIINHLKFNYKYIGKGNKLEILNNWLTELNLKYENVAYIGDDINDIEVMKLVGYSACPYDAVDLCKKTVNYICKNNGGNGCVREFVETIVNNKTITIVDEIRNEVLYQTNNFPLKKIQNISNMIKEATGNIYFAGVGKSGNMAKHCCDLLKCISLPTFYLDLLNCTHGDIGTVRKNDLIFLFSNSGNTKEIVDLIPLFHKFEVYTVGICSNVNSKFTNLCNDVIILPFNKEIDGEINKIPTHSCMNQLIFSNILVSSLKKYISLSTYKNNHLGGNIGKNLYTINDVLIKDFPKIEIENNKMFNINNILLEMTKYNIGCCCFVKDGKMLGLITDGDIRRMLINSNTITNINIENIRKEYLYETDPNKYLLEIKKKHTFIPLIVDGILKGLFRI